MSEMNEIPKIPETEEDWIRGAEIRMMSVNAYKRLVRLRMAAPPERATPPVLAAPANSAVLPEPHGKGAVCYTADQLRAYGQACAAAERAACAVICDRGASQMVTSQQRDGAARCASIIRART